MSSDDVIVGSLSTDPLSTEMHWKIELLSELPKKRYYIVHSPFFQFQGQDWRLSLSGFYLFEDFILIYLSRKGPSVPNQTVKCQSGIKHGHHLITSKKLHAKIFLNHPICSMAKESPEWKIFRVLSVLERSAFALEDETEALLLDGVFTFFCRLSVEGTTKEASTQTTVNIADNVLITLSQNLEDLYVDKKHCDVTIKVENETFAAHRAILGARTPLLEAMFSHNMAEAKPGVICVEDCDSKAFETFLMFVYSGTVNLTSENVASVYHIAAKYDVPELKKECVRYMMSNLAIDIICDVINVAARHDDKVLLEKATEFFKGNPREIFVTPRWERFMKENTAQANKLILLSFTK